MTTMLWVLVLLTAAFHAQVARPASTTEVVAPDWFWCPMHPNVRSPVPGACPICRMTLAPIPAPTVGEYRLEVEQRPATNGRGLHGLRLTIREPGSKRQASSFVTVHDKPLHLFIIGRDLEYFSHSHPDQIADGAFELQQEIPPGEYMVMADFLPAGGTPQMVPRAIVTPGHDVTRAARALELRLTDVAETPGAGGLRVAMETRDVAAGRLASLRFTVSDARTGAPVLDLEPYLSAPGHVVLASADLTHVTHGHPDDQDTRGPTVTFEILMPLPGRYKVWLQVQRMGRVHTLPFVLQVK